MLTTQDISPKSGLTAFVLCFFLGILGIHRFYVGKIGTGILMLITFGGLGFWVLYDLFSLACKTFTDKEGRTVEIPKSPNAPRNVTLLFACLYILLAGLTVTLTYFGVKEITVVGKNELLALRQGNIEQAYSYTSSEFQKGVDIATFKKFVNSYPQLHDNVDSTFKNIQYKNNEGSIIGTLSLKDGSTTPVEMALVYENNQWKVNEINVKKIEPQADTSGEDTSAE